MTTFLMILAITFAAYTVVALLAGPAIAAKDEAEAAGFVRKGQGR